VLSLLWQFLLSGYTNCNSVASAELIVEYTPALTALGDGNKQHKFQ